MIEFVAHNMAPIMFLSLIVFMLLGYPVAFSLAANGLIFFFIGVELMRKGLIDVKPLITHTLGIDDAVAAFEIAGDRSQAMKAQIAFT